MIIRYLRIGLKIIGAWPGPSSSQVLFALLGSFVFSLIFQISNLMMVITELDLLMNNLGTTMPVMAVVLKLSAFRLKFRSVRVLIGGIQKWKCERGQEREVMLKNTRIAFYLSNVIAVCYNGLILTYLTIAIMSYTAEDINDRQFVMQATFPIEESKRSPIYEMLCFLQFAIAFFAANSHVVIEGLLTVSVLHSSTMAFVVCQEIRRFSEVCQTDGKCRERVLRAKEKLIAKHLNFINFTECIRDIFSYVSFFHLFVMTLINCVVGYMLINLSCVNKDNMFTLLLCIAYMSTALLAVASYCIAGEFLTSQGTQIFKKLYDIPWHKFKPADIRILTFMVMRSRQPVTISAGGFGNLSLVYFTHIINTSASYLSLLRATSK